MQSADYGQIQEEKEQKTREEAGRVQRRSTFAKAGAAAPGLRFKSEQRDWQNYERIDCHEVEFEVVVGQELFAREEAGGEAGVERSFTWEFLVEEGVDTIG